MVNPIFGDFIAGAGEVYMANNYDMVLTVADSDKEAEVYKSLKTRGTVDGVILHGPMVNDERIDLMYKLDLPFVVHGRATGVEAPYSWLDVNNRSAFRRATNFLIDLGHKRIALMNGLEEMDFADRRRSGFEQALEARGLALDPALLHSGEMTESYGYLSTQNVLNQPNPPTAILVSSIISALGVRRAIEERGLRMGHDVSVITHDDCLSYLSNDGQVPIFTATRSSVRDAGRALSQMLIDRINMPNANHKHILLEAELTVGQSTGPAPAHFTA